ncbi:DoxX family protein [Arthrobacter sp. GMC3]|uniref:DoxX family protein n=1 Tax=Arthrobacter sp. GMC3 TaxID=2058894 RepID=UPI000CE3BC46|nr:DoxX family protein [Arthrobacter sp. GMC3]
MNIVLWIVQILLAAMFFSTGLIKCTQPVARLAEKMSWVTHYKLGTVRFVGIAETLGAIGLILPQATGIAPILTPIAAVALAVVMVLASRYHLIHKEFSGIGINAVLFVLAVFVAWGRFASLAG